MRVENTKKERESQKDSTLPQMNLARFAADLVKMERESSCCIALHMSRPTHTSSSAESTMTRHAATRLQPKLIVES